MSTARHHLTDEEMEAELARAKNATKRKGDNGKLLTYRKASFLQAALLNSFRTPYHQARAGRSGGRSRSAAKLAAGVKARSRVKNFAAGGRVQGRNAAESGQAHKNLPIGRHTRWHVNRGVSNPNCNFCTGEVI
jgi:hypothetical protein